MSGIINTIIGSIKRKPPILFDGSLYITSSYIESVTAAVMFENDGSISVSSSSSTGLESTGNDTISDDSWYSPNTSNIGSSYWIKATLNGGTQPTQSIGTFGSWTALSSGVYWQSSASGTNNTVSADISISISSSSSGTPVIGTGNVIITADTGNAQMP